MRTVMKSEKDLAKVGQDRAIPTSVATALTKEIKEFLDDQAPLMVLMSSPGVKKVPLFLLVMCSFDITPLTTSIYTMTAEQ